MWCSAADTHLKLLDRVVSDACLFAGGVLNSNLSHRRSVAMLCILYKIRCNPMHPLCGALTVPFTHGTLTAYRYTYAPPRCRTSQYRWTFIPYEYLSATIWLTPYSMVWDWRVSRAGPMPFCWSSCSLLFCLQLFFLSLLFLYRLVVWGWGLRTDRVSISLSRSCIANLFNNNNNNNNNTIIIHLLLAKGKMDITIKTVHNP